MKRNSKSEILNSKQYLKSKFQNPKSKQRILNKTQKPNPIPFQNPNQYTSDSNRSYNV